MTMQEEMPWQLSHIMLCLHEEYRFDSRPTMRKVMEARARLRDNPTSLPEMIALEMAVKDALPLIIEDRKQEWELNADHSWTHGIIDMMGQDWSDVQ